MCILMGKRLAVFLSFLFFFKVFGVKNAKIDFLKEKMVLRVFFTKLTLNFMWLQTGLSHLKTPNNFIKLTFMWLQTGLSDLKNTN